MAFFGLGARFSEKVSLSRFSRYDEMDNHSVSSANLEADTETLTSDPETESHADSEFDENNATSYLTMLSNMLFTGAVERKPSYVNGIDAWLPSDPELIAEVPEGLQPRYTKVYPLMGDGLNKNGSFAVITCEVETQHSTLNGRCSPSLVPEVEGFPQTHSEPSGFDTGAIERSTSRSPASGDDCEASSAPATPRPQSPTSKPPIYHLTISFWKESREKKHVLSLYRSRRVTDVIALCERCRECSELFRINPKGVEKGVYLTNLLSVLRQHLLWHPVHIAAKLGIVEYFKPKNRKIRSSLRILSQPEGLTPLMIAVQNDKLAVVQLLLSSSCVDVTMLGSSCHNNVMHFAAAASCDMVKLLMDLESEKCTQLLNAANADNCTPLYLAVMGANPYCAKALKSYGAALTANVTSRSTPLMEAMKKNKMDTATMRSIFEASPEALKECDPTTGNGVLHSALYKKPLLALLELKSSELNLDCRNSLMQTPLHLFVHRNDLALVMALSAYNVDLNAKDNNGNTPLHLAVSNLNLEIVRLLLCLGAETNIVNNQKETPRHLAAKFKSSNSARDIIRSLIICGARTCPSGFIGCNVACVHSDNFVGEPALKSAVALPSAGSGTLDDETRCEDDKVAGVGVHPQAATGAYEYELDPDSQKVDDAYTEPSPLRNYPQQQSIERVLRTLREFAEKKGTAEESNVISILALDGGGIKGLVIVQIMICLQKYLDAPFINYFDWVGGTSTGAFVAASFLTGKSLRDMQKMYLRFKDILFDSWSRPYNTAVLEGFLTKSFGENLTMGDVKYPRTFFTTVRADTFPAQLELSRNYRLPVSDEENEELGFADPAETLIWRAARRSSAAPTYFSASEGKFIDGGMASNNPTLDLMSEIHFWNSTCRHKAPDAGLNVDVGCVLSIGTGITPISPVDPSLFEMSDMFGMLRGMKNLTLMVLDQATATEGAPISRSRSWCHSLGIPYFRLNAPLFKDILLDSKEDSDLVKMMWDVVVYSHTHRKDFAVLADLLKAIGINKHRKKRV